MVDSPYYPPRAGFFSPLLGLGDRVIRASHEGLLSISRELTLTGCAAAFFIPGMGILLRDRTLGKVAMIVCAVAAVVFMAALGYPASNFAMMAILSIHFGGLTYYLRPLLGEARLFFRLFATLMLFVAVLQGMYLPLLHYCENHWFMPIRLGQSVVVIHVGVKPPRVKRGDWVAYRYEGWNLGVAHMRSGVNIGPVVAIGGDELQFTDTNLVVNGIARARLDGMPHSGGVSIPQKIWFEWANFDISGHGYSAEAVAEMRVHAGIVSSEQYIGQPFRWWFWRNQSVP